MSRYFTRSEVAVLHADVQFLLDAHADRSSALRRAASAGVRGRRPRRVRRALGRLLVGAGIRLAPELRAPARVA